MGEPAAQYWYQRKIEPATEIEDFLVLRFDELAAEFCMLARIKMTAGADTAAGVRSCVNQGHRRARSNEITRRRQSGKACPGNDDAKTVHERPRQQCRCHL